MVNSGKLDEAESDSPMSTSERCERERALPPAVWEPRAGPWKNAIGVFYGMRFPWSERTIKWLGPGWLTKAFRKAGTLGNKQEVASIKCLRSLGARGAAERFLLEVVYGSAHEGLHTKLLVQTPLEDSDRHQEIVKEQPNMTEEAGPFPFLQAEDYLRQINFYRLYEDECDFVMPKFYFGDITNIHGKFILITEWVPLPGETDDVRQRDMRQLWKGDRIRNFDDTDRSLEEQYYLVGPHGKCLAVHRGTDMSKSTKLCMSPTRDASSLWTLRPFNKDQTRYIVAAPNGLFLTADGTAKQNLRLTATIEKNSQWRFEPAPGERHKLFIRSGNDMFLASMDNEEQTIYMSSENDSEMEKWRRVGSSDTSGTSVIEHLELRGASAKDLKSIIVRGATLAGRFKSGKLGAKDFIEKSFVPAVLHPEKVWEFDEDWRGLGDTEFIERAAKAQEFIVEIAAALFPEGTITLNMMKGYRAMLVTTRANINYIRWYCSSNEAYVGVGHDRLDIDSAYRFYQHPQSPRPGIGIRDWAGISIGPLGSKLWGWLRGAESDILKHDTDELLQFFIDTFKKSGGPQLELSELRTHFIMAAALESVLLLDALPAIYRCWPKDQWDLIEGLRDTRLLGKHLGQGSLWICLKSLVNIALVLSTCDMVEELYRVMPRVFHKVVHVATPSDKLAAGVHGTEVRARPDVTSALISRFPAKFPLVATGRREQVTGSKDIFLEVKLPVYGWVEFSEVEFDENASSSTLAGAVAFFERLFHTRRQYTGKNPLGMSAISMMKLAGTLTKYDEMFQTLQLFGHGDCHAVEGGFLADKTRRRWWPKGYEDWARHDFLVFDDGSIADITADQFDDLPQLWWPADEQRYTFDISKVSAAESIRASVGIRNWTAQMKADKTIPLAKKRYKWWEQVAKHPSGILPSQAKTIQSPQRIRVSTNPNPGHALVLRDGTPARLPSVQRSVPIGADRPPATFRRLSEEDELEVWLVEELFTSSELNHIVSLCEGRNGFRPSMQTTTSGKQVIDGRRTSQSCALHWPLIRDSYARADELSPEVEAEFDAAEKATQLCARALEVDAAFIEPLQLVKYTPGQFFRPHLDTHKEPDRLSSHIGEQRVRTLLVFMNDVPQEDGGGYLHFPEMRLKVLPKVGSAVLWPNVRKTDDGAMRPDPRSLHEGEPPFSSPKVAMNVWVSDRRYTSEAVTEGFQRKLRNSQGNVRPA